MTGMLKCYRHKFETDDIEKWDRHCYYTGHTITIWENGKGEVEEPYPRHHMRDMHRGMIPIGMGMKKKK